MTKTLAQQLSALCDGLSMQPDLTQLLSPTEAAKMKGLTLNAFKYRLREHGGLNEIVIGDQHKFYLRSEVKAWNPPIKTGGRKRK